MTKTKLMPVKEITDLFTRNYNRRRYAIHDVKEFAYGLLKPYKAYIFSRILPKDMLLLVMEGKRGLMFQDNILDYHTELAKLDPLKEVIETKRVEELFLTVHLAEILALVGGRHGDG